MRTTVQRWGNSLGLRLPAGIARDACIAQGAVVDLTVENGEILVRPVHRQRFDLADLLGKVTRSNLHDEVETGDPVGRETW